MEEDFRAWTRLIADEFATPGPRLKDMLTRRRDKKKERAAFLAKIELEILARSYDEDLGVALPNVVLDELEERFVKCLLAMDFMCRVAFTKPNEDHSELRDLMLKTSRLYNALFDGLMDPERHNQAIFRLPTLTHLNAWYREIYAGFHVQRALDAETTRKLMHITEPAWTLPFVVDDTGLKDGWAELRFDEMRGLQAWFERRIAYLPEGREFAVFNLEIDMDVQEEHRFETYPEDAQNLLMLSLGAVVSLEQLCRYSEAYPSEQVLDQLVDELVRGASPLLRWLDFGHIGPLATLYARADRLDLTTDYEHAGGRRYQKPRLVWDRSSAGQADV